MGIGFGSGENRAEIAAKAAINSPLLDLSIEGAKGVLFAIAGGEDMTMHEIQEAAKVITQSIDPDAKVIFGAIKDDKLKKGEIKVTVIASGFNKDILENSPALQMIQNNNHISEKKQLTFEANYTKNKEGVTAEENSDDWSSVPAFLRRSKK